MNPMDLAMRLLKQDLPDWTKDLFDSKGNLKNYYANNQAKRAC